MQSASRRTPEPEEAEGTTARLLSDEESFVTLPPAPDDATVAVVRTDPAVRVLTALEVREAAIGGPIASVVDAIDQLAADRARVDRLTATLGHSKYSLVNPAIASNEVRTARKTRTPIGIDPVARYATSAQSTEETAAAPPGDPGGANRSRSDC